MQLVCHTTPFTAYRVSATSKHVRNYVSVSSRCSPAPVLSRVESRCWATAPNPAQGAAPGEDFEGLLSDEDAEIPGNYYDAMDKTTKLGKAVRAAVDELNHLNALELENLQKCDDLLKKLGFKASIMQAPPAAPLEEEAEAH